MAEHTNGKQPPLDVAATLRGKRILFIGATGFVGKVVLSMLLRRYPDLGKLFVLVRPGAGSSSEERFFDKIVPSPTFDPIREAWGPGTDAFLREKCVPLAGDVSRPNLNFSDADFEKLGHLDVIVNCAGVVDFDPPLETAIRINVLGPKHTLDVAKRTGASVVHVSTCFVAGARDGEIWEDEPVAGYFPRGATGELVDDDFDAEAELADCQRIIAEVKARADDRAHVSEFRDRAHHRLIDEGRDPDDEKTMKVAVQRERKMWIAEQLRELGMERARHWGWTNTYTYTKSLGDQVCARSMETHGVRSCIVRPAIVESSVAYPFPGWNEGFTTTAPLAFLSIKGHRTYPAGEGVVLDIIPVDMVAAGLIMATAATLAGENALVYQLGSSDTNPLTMRRAVELLGLHKRRYYQARKDRGEGSTVYNFVASRLEPEPVSRERYRKLSAPLWKSLADGLTSVIDDLTPRWGAPRLQGVAEHMKERLAQVSRLAEQTDKMFELFMPFIVERKYQFRCDNTRALFARLTPADRHALPWAPESIEWRQYWLDVHMVALEKWIFPDLEEEFKAKPKAVYTYKDLLEMFDATTKHHKNRVAMRLLPGGDEGIAERWSYADLQNMAARVGAALRERGVVPGDKVMLVSENRPEWGITYFGILKAGAVAVPLDWQASLDEVKNLAAWSHARALIWSDKVRARLTDEAPKLVLADDAAAVGYQALDKIRFDELLGREPRAAAVALHNPKGDELASVIFTSGTTGRPKGVMLSHRNFSSLIAKLASVFDIDKHDTLLSVLPLHHTFEFTAGLLVPLMRGAQITYLPEVDAESLERALDDGGITGMVGVPALWQALYRKIEKQVRERGEIVTRLFELIVEGSRRLRDKLPPAFDTFAPANWQRFVFWPVHQKLGGRLRLMISGGSALPPDVMKTFRGLGFNLFEGYGLTEAAPVLTVNRPGTRLIPGSVGEPLPGIEVKIADPDERGVGEVVASGPNVMVGYFENPEATAEVVKGGWLHTGDLGKIDEDGRLYIVGRKKEMILGANGENVYPDELEELYRDHPCVKELSIVGLPDGDSELVAMLAVPDYEARGETDDGEPLPRAEVQARVLEHFRAVSAKLPLWKRVKVVHLTDLELPKTATRKVKRREVVKELEKLEHLRRRAEAEARGDTTAAAAQGGGASWMREVLAAVCGKPVDSIASSTGLPELGFDSLMYTELGVALEAAGVAVPENADLTGLATVADFERQVRAWGRRTKKPVPKAARPKSEEASEIHIPKPIVDVGGAALTYAQRMTYERLFKTKVTGRAYIPRSTRFIVAANHASHLDMGLVKHALGDWGERLVALAAKDYFFEDPIKRAYFENFTNLVPMDRHGSLRESLRLASDQIHQGNILLIFPEGTRSTTGVMVDFKPSLGYLALTNKVDVLPMYLAGTHDALPKGSVLPKRRDIAAHIGPVVRYEELVAATRGLSKSESYREASRLVELRVRALAPAGDPNRQAAPATPRAADGGPRLTSASVVVQDAPSFVGNALVRDAEKREQE
jgi:long-chain acyl-CoA synthetase